MEKIRTSPTSPRNSHGSSLQQPISPNFYVPIPGSPNIVGTAELVCFGENDLPMTTSLKVAEVFNRRHDVVLKSIQDLECSGNFRDHNFKVSKYSPENQKRQYLMYHITRDGFTFLAMGFTGKKASKFKEAYIAAFNKMEKEVWRRRIKDATRHALPPAIAPDQQGLIQNVVCEAVYAIAKVLKMGNDTTPERIVKHERLTNPKQHLVKGNLNLKIDPDLKRRAKIYCAEEGITLSEFIEIAIQRHLDRLNNEK